MVFFIFKFTLSLQNLYKMKKSTYFFKILVAAFAGLILLCCNKENLSTTKSDDLFSEAAFTVSQKDALKSAINFADAMFETTATKTTSERTLANVEFLFANEATTKSSEEPPICYLFNFSDNKGYVLISADKRTEGRVFLASEKGRLNLESLQKSPYAFLLECIEQYQNQECNSSSLLTKSDDGNYYTVETITASTTKGPLLNTQWNQIYPYNSYLSTIPPTEYYPMGCATVAMGQILAYYNKPSVITTGGVNYNIDWSTIANQTYPLPLNPDQSWVNATSYFLYAIADLIDITYSYGGSGTTISKVLDGYDSLGADYSYSSSYSIDNIISSLANNKPVNILGWTTGGDGHSWIIDGCKSLTIDVASYDEFGNPIENTILNPDYNYTAYRKYWHCNFGWGGSEDGDYIYYRDNYIDGWHLEYIYSSIFNTPYGNFNENIRLIYNISL